MRFIISGAIYRGVPTFILSMKPRRDRAANPKSEIFHLLPILKILAGFMSLWTKLCECRKEMPHNICKAILQRTDSNIFGTIYAALNKPIIP